jgi:hypothetical protein
MTAVIQLSEPTEDAPDDKSGFERYGLQANPFPETGVDTGVLFQNHIREPLKRIDRWLEAVSTATATDSKRPEVDARPIAPIAIFGSNGAGKTHILYTLRRALEREKADEDFEVLYKALTEEGMTRLVLANLLLRYLPGGTNEDGALAILVDIAAAGQRSIAAVTALDEGSPIRTPLGRALESRDPAQLVHLSRWLRREQTSPNQRAQLGLSGMIEAEGQALHAIGDLLVVARKSGVLRGWFVLLDQLEELWRPGVITPSRRARFLTDLRLLVDLGAERGAPIAVVCAWNTVLGQSVYGKIATEEAIQRDYHALWRRFGDPLQIPPLEPQHIWPFAEKYLEAAGVRADSKDARRKGFYASLKGRQDDVVRRLKPPEGSRPYRILEEWRREAEALAHSDA